MPFKVHLGSASVNSPAWLRSGPGRVLAVLLGLLAIAGLLLFFTVFLMVGALLLVYFGVRMWWRMRRLSRQSMRPPVGDVVDVEHSVMDVEAIETPRLED